MHKFLQDTGQYLISGLKIPDEKKTHICFWQESGSLQRYYRFYCNKPNLGHLLKTARTSSNLVRLMLKSSPLAFVEF